MRLSHSTEKLSDVKGRGKAVQIGDWLEMGAMVVSCCRPYRYRMTRIRARSAPRLAVGCLLWVHNCEACSCLLCQVARRSDFGPCRLGSLIGSTLWQARMLQGCHHQPSTTHRALSTSRSFCLVASAGSDGGDGERCGGCR